MKISRRTDASSPSGGVQAATGTYTGDGAVTLGITGVGFQPRLVIVYARKGIGGNTPTAFKNDQDGLNASTYFSGGRLFRFVADDIVSLDADGFTVGDGTPIGINYFNVLNEVYSYMCFR